MHSDYAYIDPAEVEKQMRDMRAEMLPGLLAGAKTAAERAGYEAQDRLFEATLVHQLEMIRMVNEGRDAAFIGRVIGAAVAHTIVNTLAAGPDPATCLRHMQETVQRTVVAAIGESVDGVTMGASEVRRQPGGRA